jgi:hypothetical protein
MLDLDPSSISRLLGDMVARLLVKTSRAERGRGVTYRPGTGFPTAKRKSSRLSSATPENLHVKLVYEADESGHLESQARAH